MLCIHYFLIKRKKLFGRPNTRRKNKSLYQNLFDSFIVQPRNILLNATYMYVQCTSIEMGQTMEIN